MKAKNLADLYDLPTLDWAPIVAVLDKGFTQAPDTGGPNRFTHWLATINKDGSPHLTALGALWDDGAFWFTTSQQSRKGRNIARDPRCTMTISTHEFDLAVDGVAELVTDKATVAKLAALWAVEWPCRVDDSGIALTADFSAPSAGPPPWHIYRLTPTRATALATTGTGGATTWTF